MLGLGEPWQGVEGLGRDEEVEGTGAGLLALSLAESPSEFVARLGPCRLLGRLNRNLLQVGCTRYLRGSGPVRPQGYI